MTPGTAEADGRLFARTVPLEADVDLVDVAGDDGVLWERAGSVSLAGRGVAAVLALPWEAEAAGRVAARMASIEWTGDHPPVAVGALPFSRSTPGHLCIPRVLVRREPDGTHWLTAVVTAPAAPEAGHLLDRAVEGALSELACRRGPGRPASPGPAGFRVSAVVDRERWRRAVADAAKAVADGSLGKVVLAREVAVEADLPLSPAAVTRRLRTAYPACMVFSVEGFVGASPELLVERRGREVLSQPLAGTAARPGTADSDARVAPVLMSSDKEREEHRLVVEAVAAALAAHCDELAVPETPALVTVGSIAHLGTLVRGRLRQPPAGALALVEALHPTPAVGGTPTAAALDYIAAVEGIDRARYAGPVGWTDALGDGCWAVGIRSAQLDGRRARLMAGAGIVAGSDPDSELAETELKLQPMLTAIIRP